MEAAVIETVENGLMTKDLAISVAGTTQVPRSAYLNTQDFMDKVKETYEKRRAHWCLIKEKIGLFISLTVSHERWVLS